MKRILFPVFVVAAIPAGGWFAGTRIESHFQQKWADHVVKQFGAQGLAAIASGQLSLDWFCSQSQAKGEAVCRTHKNVLLLN